MKCSCHYCRYLRDPSPCHLCGQPGKMLYLNESWRLPLCITHFDGTWMWWAEDLGYEPEWWSEDRPLRSDSA